MKLGAAQKALAAVTAVFVIFTLAFFIGRSSSRAVVTTQKEPEVIVREIPVYEPVPDVKLNINKATADELEDLPGIGEVLAQRILHWREQNGSFISTEQLMDVEGIGEAKFAAIKDRICVEDGA